MKKLKWFSGGNERAEQAIQLIDELLRDFDDSSSHSDRLRTVLRNNREALIHKQAAVPFILSRMNLEISNALFFAGEYQIWVLEATTKTVSALDYG